MTLVRSKKAGGRHSTDKLPIQNLPVVDETRMRLREIAQKISGGQTLTDLPTIPGVSSLSIAVRKLPGGRMQFMEFAQFAALNLCPAAQKFWMVLADLSINQRATVSYDDVCAAAGVRPSQLLMEIMGCAMEFGHDVGNLVAAAAHVSIVHQTTKSAMRIGGDYAKVAQRDREMLFEHHGFIPVAARAASVTVNANASANAQAAAAVSADPSVPSFSGTMRGLQSIRDQTQRRLEAGEANEPIDVVPTRVTVTVPGGS